MNKQIFLVRHTTPDIEKGTCYGHTDLPVASSFLEEVAEIQQILPALQGVQVYASPLQRCRLLAERLACPAEQHLPIVFDDRLKEMHFGDWEMKLWADIHPETLQNWMQDFVDTPAPAGESHRQVYNRAVAFWEETLQQPHETFCIVTHYGVMQNLLAYLLHIPLDKLFKIDMGFGAVVRVTLGAGSYCKVKFLK